MKISNFLLFVLAVISLPPGIAPAQTNDRPALVIVLVIDGLRPDSITNAVMPNLDHIRKAGVSYTRSHSVFPTVTRVNTASLSTGTLPSQHGIVSNSLYLPRISDKLLNDADYQTLLSLAKLNGGRIVGPKSLGEYLSEAGIRYVAISSGSTGNAVLLNPTAPFGNGTLINSGFENGARVAFPDTLNSELLTSYGKVQGDSGSLSLVWTERVLREYVLDKLRPQVIIDWIGQPDGAQHSFGVGSPEAITALRLVDQQIGLLQDKLRQMGLEGKTDIIVTCDHGFDYEPASDLLAPVREAGLGDDVVVDNEGGTSLFYFKGHDALKIEGLAKRFQATEAANSVFVAAARPANGTFVCTRGSERGFAPGTFALELANQCLPSHGPDMIVTWHWEPTANPFGAAGTQLIQGRPVTAPQTVHSGHGSLNPYTTHTVLLATGMHFKKGKVIDLPAGNEDIMPTLLALEGLPVPGAVEGRLLSEALIAQATGALPKQQNRRIEASTGAWCSELAVSYAGDHRYLDFARRCNTAAKTSQQRQ